MPDGILTLRGRVAWAHDYDPDRSIATTFQTLPGASFVVNGAAQASDSALVTASVEKKWLNGWSAAATFEGEFSDVTRIRRQGRGAIRVVSAPSRALPYIRRRHSAMRFLAQAQNPLPVQPL